MKKYLKLSISIIVVMTLATAMTSADTLLISQEPGSSSRAAGSTVEFVFVKGGCYMMGNNVGEGSDDELPLHRVCLDDFSIGKYEITVRQWEKIMGEAQVDSQNKDHPVINISWQKAQQFIAKLGQKTGSIYRLPTEAEWEYAARGGQNQNTISARNMSQDSCNLDGTSEKDLWERTSPVGSFSSNTFGIFDMCGNVWEWIEDDYEFNAYQKHSPRNPLIKTDGSAQTIRGCGWSDSAEDCSLYYRDKLPPDCTHCSRRNDVGLRIVKQR